MKTHYLLLAALILSTSFCYSQSHTTSTTDSHSAAEHIILNENDLVWKTGPSSLPPGSMIAVLEGDPSKTGPFCIRLQFPANYKVAPHYHPAIEHVSILEGSMFMGTGREYNEATTKEMKKGAFGVMPIQYPHYAFTKEKAILQLHGMGPWGITYLNEADDPRKQTGSK